VLPGDRTSFRDFLNEPTNVDSRLRRAGVIGNLLPTIAFGTIEELTLIGRSIDSRLQYRGQVERSPSLGETIAVDDIAVLVIAVDNVAGIAHRVGLTVCIVAAVSLRGRVIVGTNSGLAGEIADRIEIDVEILGAIAIGTVQSV